MNRIDSMLSSQAALQDRIIAMEAKIESTDALRSGLRELKAALNKNAVATSPLGIQESGTNEAPGFDAMRNEIARRLQCERCHAPSVISRFRGSPVHFPSLRSIWEAEATLKQHETEMIWQKRVNSLQNQIDSFRSQTSGSGSSVSMGNMAHSVSGGVGNPLTPSTPTVATGLSPKGRLQHFHTPRKPVIKPYCSMLKTLKIDHHTASFHSPCWRPVSSSLASAVGTSSPSGLARSRQRLVGLKAMAQHAWPGSDMLQSSPPTL